jgi:hypothetical protein
MTLALTTNPANAQPPNSHGGHSGHSVSAVHSSNQNHFNASHNNYSQQQYRNNHNYNNNNYNNGHYNHGNYYNGFYNGFFPSVVVYPSAVVTTYGPTVTPEYPDPANNNDNGVNQDTYVVDNSSPAETTQDWVPAANGQVPNGAVPYSDDNNPPQAGSASEFYCRGQYNNQSYSGVLVAGEGCFIDDRVNAATIRLQNYQVLVNN